MVPAPATSSPCAAPSPWHRWSTKTQEALIDECKRPSLERQQIAAGLVELPASVGELQAALNKLHTIVGWAGRCSGPDERSGLFQAFPCGACYGADGWGRSRALSGGGVRLAAHGDS